MDDVELAITAARAGAAVVRDRAGSPMTRIGKGGGDFATDVDVEAERAIIDLLVQNRPADRIVAEESGATGDRARRGTGSSIRCAAPATSPHAPAWWRSTWRSATATR